MVPVFPIVLGDSSPLKKTPSFAIEPPGAMEFAAPWKKIWLSL
jgi:hypothetical protein